MSGSEGGEGGGEGLDPCIAMIRMLMDIFRVVMVSQVNNRLLCPYL